MKQLQFLYFFFFSTLCFGQDLDKDNALTDISDIVKEINAQYDSGVKYLEKEDLDKAHRSIYEGLRQATFINDENLIATGNFHWSSYYLQKKEYSEAISYCKKAISIFESINDQGGMANSHEKLGRIYRKISDFEKTLFHDFESLRLNELINDQKAVARLLNEIGSVYLRTRDFDNANIQLKRSLKINQEGNYQKGIVDNNSNLGAMYQKLEKFDNAIAHYKLALSQAKKIDAKINESILLGNIGSTNRSLGNYEESLNYLFQALKLKKELKRYGSVAHSCNDISETYMKMNRFDKAKEFALKAIEFAKDERLDQERYAYFLLSKCNYELKEFKNSYDNLRIYGWLNDSIYNMRKTASINELQIMYETEKRDLKIKVQESDIALLDAENKTKNQLLLFGSLGLIALFSIVMLYLSKSNAKQRQIVQEQFSQDLIAGQEKERTRISKDLHDSVGQQLTLIKKKAQKLDQKELSKMSNDALEEVRSISRDLYPSILKQLGFTQSVEQLVNDLDEGVDMFFTVEVDEVDKELNEEKSLNLYRFIQESLSNVIKHSNAKAVSVTITKNLNQIETIVSDNGKGFNSAMIKNSLGLKTMAERIKMLQGTLSIKSRVDQGTTLIAQIPV